jgi:nucleotide-binding universal stress UspA family protein
MDERARSFLVVIDGTPESSKALRFAALRAAHTGATVKLLHILEPTQFQQWGGVQEALEAEAEDEARAALASEAAVVEEILGQPPLLRIRKGHASDEVLAELTEDRSVRALVLAAAAKGRPGPLISFFSSEKAGALPCLVMIVPGGIDDADLDRLT